MATEDKFFKRIYNAAFLKADYTQVPKRKTKLSMKAPIDFMEGYSKIDKEDYYKIFLDIPAVRGAVDAIVNATTGSGYKIKTAKESDPEKDDPKVKEIKLWLNHPNKGFYSILRAITTNLVVSDDSYTEVKPNDEVKEEDTYGWFWPLDNLHVKVQLTSDKKEISHIIYKSGTSLTGGTGQTLQPHQFQHGSMNLLGSNLYGISSIESLIKLANLYNYATGYNTALFESGGVPAVVFTMKSGTDPDYERMIEMLNETKTGRSLGLFGDIDLEKVGVTNQDINFQGIFDHVTQMVMSVFQVPPVMMSMQGASTKETSKSEMNAFGGKIRAIQWMVNTIVSSIIHKVWGEEYNDIRFVLNPWQDLATMSAIHKIYLTTGVLTPNDVRRELDLPDVDWGDAPYNPNFPHPDTGLLPPEGEGGKPGGGRPGGQTGASGDSPSGNTDPKRPADEGTDKPKKDLGYYLDDINIKLIAKALVDNYERVYSETSETDTTPDPVTT